ncbi:tyrosine--tRNA ligase [Candidatus Saccharibacteria bacterium]|nr:tyrosine--tRNA ligase [Candidatus Saccharibacteria bacterium]
MNKTNIKLSEELAYRGFVNQTTLGSAKDLDDKKFTFYWGVDPSSDSMTVGNLATAMMVRHFIEHGHKAVLLVGGATGLIGDPDGKASERDLLSPEQVAANKEKIVSQYKTIFSGLDFEVVDNLDWFKDINYIDFLRDVGKHVPMRQMLGREFVQSRLGESGSGISYAEFSYSLIQGYDFLHLYKNKGVTLQVCGSDQWGNSIAGVELVRRIAGAEVHIWSAPLVVNKTTGVKFGKSEEGAVWLDELKTSAYSFYQFWLNIDDESVSEYLKIFTLLDKEAIEEVLSKFISDKGSRLAQKKLAYEVTKVVHGEKRAASVVKATDVLFGKAKISELDEDDIKEMSKEIPLVGAEDSLIKTLVSAGLASSNSEAMRFIEANAVTVNGEKAGADYAFKHGYNLLKRGKNSFAIVKA